MHKIRSDRGAGFVEYAGAILMMGVISASVILAVGGAGGLGTTVKDGIETSICRAFSMIGLGDCETESAAPEPVPPPPCEIASESSERSIDGHFRNVRVETSTNDNLVYRVDPTTGEPTAQYSTRGNTSVGAEQSQSHELGELEELFDGSKPSYELFVQGGVGVTSNYKFDGPDAHEQAEAMRDLRRGEEYQQWLAAVGGSSGAAAEAGATDAAHQIERLWAQIPATDSDVDSVDAKYEELLPDSVTIDLNAEGYAGGAVEGEYGGGTSLEAGGNVSAEGQQSLEINRDMTREHTVSMGVDAEVTAEGGLELGNVLPQEYSLALEASGGGNVTQRTSFDDEGNPQEAQFEVEYELGYSVTASGEISIDTPPGVEIPNPTEQEYEIVGDTVRVRDTVRLDLTDQENLDAYNEVFHTDSGIAAVPRPDVIANLDDVSNLAEAFVDNGTRTRSTFDVESEDGDELGASRAGFGGSINLEGTEETELLSMEYYDGTQPFPEWEHIDCDG